MRAEWVPGDPISWTTIGGRSYDGVVVSVDSNVLIVKCSDGRVRSVEGWVRLPERTHERNVLVWLARKLRDLWERLR